MATKQTILLGVTHFQSTGFYRGFIDILRDQGAEVHVVSAAPPPSQQADHLQGAEFHALPMAREISPIQDLKSLYRWIRTIQKIRPDIIAVGTPKAGLLGSIASWLLRVPKRIYVVRGLRLETESGLKRKILLGMERLAAALATEVQYVSASLMEACLELKIGTRAKATVVGKGSSNGVDLEHFSRAQVPDGMIRKLEVALGVKPDLPTIGFVGRLVKDKGIEDLIEALEIIAPRFNCLQVLLIGQVETDDIKIDIRHLESIGVKIITTGAIMDVRPYYAMMDAFVLPTLREGFPNVVLEARAMEIPVVTTTATGAIDSIDGGDLGFLAEVSNPVDLARGIQDALMLSPAAREDLTSRSRADLEENYERDMHQRKIAEYYLG